MSEGNAPFFLVGCVRSGTTLLRDLLRQHPRLESPEETHFFRWADPFGTDRYRRMYKNSDLMKRHRQMDGIEDFDFNYMLNHAQSRRQMMEQYGAALLQARGNPDGRWFDKTPQNVYGVLMISAAWPEARFVHIHRHPLNVVASLMEGAVMPVHSLNGAINYWTEALGILQQFRQVAGDRLLEISYEALTAEPAAALSQLLAFLGEDSGLLEAEFEGVHPEQNKYLEKLDDQQVREVLDRTAAERALYGYGDTP